MNTVTSDTGHRPGRRLAPRSLALLPKMVFRPRKIARELLVEKTIHPSLIVVLGFALSESLLFLISYLAGDYPPPAGELRIWIETWGEFSMLPFIKVPAESYRLTMAIFIVPLMIAIWILMAGSARLLSIIFGGGRISFDQYLNLFGFSFFAFMIVAAVLDFTFSSVFGNFVSALRGEHGTFARSTAAAFPPAMYTVLYGLGGLYNAIVAREGEGYSIPKTAIVGIVTFSWPMV
jgi:hypothetical protein